MDERIPRGRDRRTQLSPPPGEPWPRRAEREQQRAAPPPGRRPDPLDDPTYRIAPRTTGPRSPGRHERQQPPPRRPAAQRTPREPDPEPTTWLPPVPPLDEVRTTAIPRTPRRPVDESLTMPVARARPVAEERTRRIADPEPEEPEEPEYRRPTAAPVRRPGRRRPRTLGRALAATAAAAVAPGTGHLMLHRTRNGRLILGTFLLALLALLVGALSVSRNDLVSALLSSEGLLTAILGCVVAAAAWIAVVIRTWVIAQPRGLDTGRRIVGLGVVTTLCLVIAAPFGFAATFANSQRNFLDEIFTEGGGTPADVAIGQPRLNILLVGSDAGPDRTGTRTDTMMVASVDTQTGYTILFALPRNIGRAEFPPNSRMGEEFPNGFHDNSDPTSGNYLLNAVYAYAHEHPGVAPAGPTADPGLNLLHQTVSYMLGLPLDYYLEVNMAGFASIIDALGGLRVDVGPERIPIGGISPSGRAVTPTGYIEPGLQQLSGADALAFARSRTNSTDYVRMGRQRCLLQYILDQKTPADLLTNFQAVAQATTDSVSTNIPQDVLPALVSIADGPVQLDSIAFDPSLPDPDQPDGFFDTGHPNIPHMREVVQEAIARGPAAPPPVTPPTTATDDSRSGGAVAAGPDEDTSGTTTSAGASGTATTPTEAAPTPVAASC